MKNAQSILTLLLLLAVAALLPSLIASQAELKNARQNARWALEQSQAYKVHDSLNALSIQQLILDRKQLKEYRQRDMKLIAQLQVDKRRLQSIGSTSTKTVYQIKTEIRDSLIYLRDTLRCFDHQGRWSRVEGCLIGDSIKLQVQSIDSLLYVEHIVPKRFWFIKWGIKERKQEILSKNPNTTILSAEFIRMEQ